MQLDLFSEADAAAPALIPPKPERSAASRGFETPPPSIQTPSNLAELLACFDDAASDHPRRAHVRSACRSAGRVLGLPLEQIPSAPEELRVLLAKATPAAVGVKPANWKQIKSALTTGMRHVGVAARAARDDTPLSPAWATLLERTPDRKLQIGLSRLLRFLSRNGIAPDQVADDAFARFRSELEQMTTLKSVEGTYRQSLRHWTKALAIVPGWPAVRPEIPRDPRRYSAEWADLPISLRAEIAAFLIAKSDTDPLSDHYARPTRPSTAAGRRKSLRILASALALSGAVPIQEVTSLEVLSRPANVRAALGYLRDERSGGTITEGHINYAWLLRTVARHWLNDEPRTEELKLLIASLTQHVRRGAGRGMTDKNRERLRQFCLPSNIDALVQLPTRTLAASRRRPERTYRDGVRIMRALQVGILTFVPIRSSNLTQLELGKHLIDVGRDRHRTVKIHLPKEITKTHRDYNAPLPRHLYPLLDQWLEVDRVRVSPRPSPYLFPNPRGELRSRDALANKLSRFIDSETGLKINPHLFRHIAAKLYLDYDPTGIEIVRQLLGHTSVKTTLAVYAELQTDPAFRRMEAALLECGYRLPTRRDRVGRRI